MRKNRAITFFYIVGSLLVAWSLRDLLEPIPISEWLRAWGWRYFTPLAFLVILLFVVQLTAILPLFFYTLAWLIADRALVPRRARIAWQARAELWRLIQEGKAPALKTGRVNRRVFRETILKLLDEVSAPDQAGLAGEYARQGFLEKDLTRLRSPKWWERLEAAANLARLRVPSTVDAVLVAVRDEHPLVAVAGLYALSAIPHEERTKIALGAMARNPHIPRDSLVAVVANLVKVDLWQTLQYLNEHRNYRLSLAALSVFGKLRVTQAVPTILLLMRVWGRHDELVAEGARALGTVGDARGVATLYELLAHESPHVRASAVTALSLLGESLPNEHAPALHLDRSSEVRQALHRARAADQRVRRTA